MMCKVLLGNNLHRLDPPLERNLPIDDPSIVPKLVKLGRELDLSETVSWIRSHFYNEASGDIPPSPPKTLVTGKQTLNGGPTGSALSPPQSPPSQRKESSGNLTIPEKNASSPSSRHRDELLSRRSNFHRWWRDRGDEEEGEEDEEEEGEEDEDDEEFSDGELEYYVGGEEDSRYFTWRSKLSVSWAKYF